MGGANDNSEIYDVEVKSFNPKLQQDSTYLFHYTSTKGLIGILSSQALWFTDAQYLNDPEEQKYFYKILKHYPVIKHEINTAMFDTILEAGQATYFSQTNIMKNGQKTICPQRYYYFSFTRNEDSSGMWSMYTNNKGWNACFDVSKILECVSSSKVSWPTTIYHGPVIYNENEQKEIIGEMIFEYANDQLKLCKTDQDIKMAHDNVAAKVELCRLFMKNPFFSSEDEFRLVLAFEPFSEDDNFKTGHQVKNGIPIPHKEVKIYDHSIEYIVSGPGLESELVEHAMFSLATKEGFHLPSIKKSQGSIRMSSD